MFPEQHATGAAAFLRLNDKGSKADYLDRKSTFSTNSCELNKNGIQSEDAAGGILCLGPEGLARFVSRLGDPAKTRAEYVVLNLPDSVAVGKWTLRNDLTNTDFTQAKWSDTARFRCRNHAIGPVDKGELTRAFDMFVNQLIKDICDGQDAEGLLNASISELLELSPIDLDAKIMLSLKTNRLRVYVQHRGVQRTSIAEFQWGRWCRNPDAPAPFAMHNFKWLKRIFYLPYGPWLALPLAAIIVYWAVELPCIWHRKCQLKKAREALSSTSGL